MDAVRDTAPAPQQDVYNEQLHKAYSSTKRTEPGAPSAGGAPADPVTALKDLADLRQRGMLSDDEFAAAKARVLGGADAAS